MWHPKLHVCPARIHWGAVLPDTLPVTRVPRKGGIKGRKGKEEGEESEKGRKEGREGNGKLCKVFKRRRP